MKYGEMVKFLNDNGIFVMQVVIANELNSQLEHSIPEEEFEDICKCIEDAYLDCWHELDIYDLIDKELIKRGYKE